MPTDSLAFLALALPTLALVGAVAGIAAGLLGVGGGIVVVPVLVQVLMLYGLEPGLAMHLTVATSLATIIPTSIMSMRAHARRGAVDTDFLRGWAPAILLGVLIGTATAASVRGAVLSGVFGITALAVALLMGFGRPETRIADQLPGGIGRWLIGGTIGGVSSMMGIGGGTLGVPILSLFSFPIRRAVGTGSAIGLIISVPATIGLIIGGWQMPDLPPFSVGYVSLPGFLALTPTQMLCAPLGARLAHSIRPLVLRRLFGLFLAVTALRMLWTTFGG